MISLANTTNTSAQFEVQIKKGADSHNGVRVCQLERTKASDFPEGSGAFFYFVMGK
jgi:hypothetical protein